MILKWQILSSKNGNFTVSKKRENRSACAFSMCYEQADLCFDDGSASYRLLPVSQFLICKMWTNDTSFFLGFLWEFIDSYL